MSAQKILIFDSSTIITFALNGLLDVLRKLKETFPGRFIVTYAVKQEIIDTPLKIKRFELEALQIKKLLDEKIIELYPIDIEKETRIKTREILEKTNHAFFARNEFMHIIDEGEASCLALSLICQEKGIESVLAVDERTTRMFGENPENLRKLFEAKLHTKVELKQQFFFKNIKFIRSSELVYLAYKKNLINLKNGNVLDALLYAVKFKGCSISRQEIEEMKRLKT